MTDSWRDKIDHCSRYQSGLKVVDLFPRREDGLCGCGCGRALPPRRTRWASDECSDGALATFWVIKGSSSFVNFWVKKRDHGVCAWCGGKKSWQADHIIPVSEGGGGCDLSGYQTLCDDCHRVKTRTMRLAKGRRIRAQEELWA